MAAPISLSAKVELCKHILGAEEPGRRISSDAADLLVDQTLQEFRCVALVDLRDQRLATLPESWKKLSEEEQRTRVASGSVRASEIVEYYRQLWKHTDPPGVDTWADFQRILEDFTTHDAKFTSQQEWEKQAEVWNGYEAEAIILRAKEKKGELTSADRERLKHVEGQIKIFEVAEAKRKLAATKHSIQHNEELLKHIQDKRLPTNQDFVDKAPKKRKELQAIQLEAVRKLADATVAADGSHLAIKALQEDQVGASSGADSDAIEQQLAIEREKHAALVKLRAQARREKEEADTKLASFEKKLVKAKALLAKGGDAIKQVQDMLANKAKEKSKLQRRIKEDRAVVARASASGDDEAEMEVD